RGVALGKIPVAHLQHRDAPVGADVGEELGRARLALHDVVLAPFERRADMRRDEADLVAVARAGVLVKDQPLHAHASHGEGMLYGTVMNTASTPAILPPVILNS